MNCKMNLESLERITPTRETLNDFFGEFPDHYQRYEFAISRISNDMRVADIACGVGYGSWLMSQKSNYVVGVDISESALSHAKKHFSSDNVEFLHGDNFSSVSEFDLVVSFETIEHMDEDKGDEFIQKIKKSLKPDGWLIMSTPINKTDNKLNVTEFHVREYDDFEFPEKLEKNGFRIVEMYGQGSLYHEKLYGVGGGSGLFPFLKIGFHRLLPQRLRNFFKKIILGDPTQELQIKRDNWRSSAVQIAVCKLK
jgi:SAM-dependent methyltransferase